jgi:hypothetical protein
MCLAIISLISSCNNDDGIDGDGQHSDMMDIENLQIGDRFLFVYLQGESYHDDDNFEFNYTSDTLELAVMDIIDQKYIVQESILPTSAIFETNDNYLAKDSIYINQWSVENDSLKISSISSERNRSHLVNLFFRNEIGFPLNEFTDEKINISGWKTEKSYVGQSFDYYTNNFTLFDNDYDRLNVMIRNTGMAVDANGWTYMYNKNQGFARVITYSAWTTRGRGWDRI